MFVYVLNNKIVLKSKERIVEMLPQHKEYQVNYTEWDRLIFENGEIKRYEYSKQYHEDQNTYHLNKELQEEKKKNSELELIAKNRIEEDCELKKRSRENDEYQKNFYLLKKLRW